MAPNHATPGPHDYEWASLAPAPEHTVRWTPVTRIFNHRTDRYRCSPMPNRTVRMSSQHPSQQDHEPLHVNDARASVHHEPPRATSLGDS